MKVEVTMAIDELKRQFSDSAFIIREDGQGGAYVVMEPVPIGSRYTPASTWFGFHIAAQYPYSDIYPIFIGANVSRIDGQVFNAPVTAGHHFEGRPALQVSRRNTTAPVRGQKATGKVLKVLDFLEKLP